MHIPAVCGFGVVIFYCRGEVVGQISILENTMVKDMENPASDILGLLSSADVQVSKVMASRRDDGISYVLAEIASQNVPSLLFQGENGAKIIRYRAIER